MTAPIHQTQSSLAMSSFATQARVTRRSVLPPSLPPLGLSREEAASYIGVSTTLFDALIADGRMPQPRMINSRTIWDIEEIYAAFKALPHRGVAIDLAASEWDRVR